ncbi:MAG TPA: dephospho-CoA kinase [Actinomycetota bacterium]|nr:dephospho-CoA kinase [Actinomycetota bacterium]
MVLVGLTGGIGAGKSTVARMLEERGAVVIDADDLARRAVEPGSHGYAEVVRAFGPDAVSLTGAIDRAWLADRVFQDPEARIRLEAILHPEVARLFTQAIEPYRGADRVVVYVVPLLVEAGLRPMFDRVVVVRAPEELRVSRLAADRGMTEAQARGRIRAQLSDAEREAPGDRVLSNGGTLGDLERQLDELWSDLSP